MDAKIEKDLRESTIYYVRGETVNKGKMIKWKNFGIRKNRISVLTPITKKTIHKTFLPLCEKKQVYLDGTGAVGCELPLFFREVAVITPSVSKELQKLVAASQKKKIHPRTITAWRFYDEPITSAVVVSWRQFGIRKKADFRSSSPPTINVLERSIPDDTPPFGAYVKLCPITEIKEIDGKVWCENPIVFDHHGEFTINDAKRFKRLMQWVSNRSI